MSKPKEGPITSAPRSDDNEPEPVPATITITSYRKNGHVFIEPEGRDSELIYPNGISNSLPEDVQEKLIHSIPGLAQARIINWAYAIEYDFVFPDQIERTLRVKKWDNLLILWSDYFELTDDFELVDSA